MIPSAIPSGWLAVGFLGQAVFSARFFVQWVASERRRESYVPAAFWWLSVAGGLLLLAYAAYRRDPVFTLGQAAGLGVYIRNLTWIRRGRAAFSTAVPMPRLPGRSSRGES